MATEFELLGPDDKPALVAFENLEYAQFVCATLQQLGYKVHTASTGEEFISRFGAVMYQVIMISETFEGASIAENTALAWMQKLPMARRRHVTIILVGMSFQTLHTMQAYQQSVHAVINPAEFSNLLAIIQKVVADTDLFMRTYREVQKAMVAGKA